MSVSSTQKSTEDWEREIGAQLRNLRIRHRLDQSALASAANVSVGAIKNLERGKGSSLNTAIKVLRALGKIDLFAALAPAVSISPLEIARSAGKRLPQRVYKRKTAR